MEMPLPLSKINELRAKHHAPALQENAELTRSAQAWADYLSHNSLFKHSGQAGKGENLAACASAEQAIDMWYHEIDAFDWSKPRFTGATGHFSALVWATTTRIGWGEARDEVKGWTVYVAQFTPAGNIAGQFAENVRRA